MRIFTTYSKQFSWLVFVVTSGTVQDKKMKFGYLHMCCILFIAVLDLVRCEKYKLCVVDGKSDFKKSLKYCGDLDVADSKVQCVVASDRTDCLRRILKGTADFSVFSPEDLVTANNEAVQILITNELRYTNDPNEYEVVAVVDKKSKINSRHDLKGKKYCHPGHGYETDWTKILANYFEASVVTPSCSTQLALYENRIKSTADFFGAACKAGPWVNEPLIDLKLKRKYSHLCALCGDPEKCSMDDKYWGRRGSLFCLTDGAGDISWARLDDVETHFGLVSGTPEAPVDRYQLLCPDDSLMALNSSNPCVWVVKPWPVVASRRTVANEIQTIVTPLSHKYPNYWRFSLLMLLETSYSTFYKLRTIEPIETFLYKATGFLSANSFSGCHPPRTITVCTTSVIERAKCSWMRESAAVYGVEPDLECIKADNKSHCMIALNMNAADVVLVQADEVFEAKRKFNLTTLFYETVSDEDKYLTVVVTRAGSAISSFEDLRGKKVCFPVYDGVAWNTMKNILFKKRLFGECPMDKEMEEFFGPSCAPGIPTGSGLDKMKQICEEDTFDGEFGALHCLASEKGDVAIVSQNSIMKFVSNNSGNSLSMEDFQVMCQHKSGPCHLSWAPIGQAMVRGNSSSLWKHDTLDVFLQLDELFGKNYKSLTNPFTMFGRYDGVPNLLFHDVTQKLRADPNFKEKDPMPSIYDNYFNTDDECYESSASLNTFSMKVLVCALSAFLLSFYRF